MLCSIIFALYNLEQNRSLKQFGRGKYNHLLLVDDLHRIQVQYNLSSTNKKGQERLAINLHNLSIFLAQMAQPILLISLKVEKENVGLITNRGGIGWWEWDSSSSSLHNTLQDASPDFLLGWNILYICVATKILYQLLYGIMYCLQNQRNMAVGVDYGLHVLTYLRKISLRLIPMASMH